MSIFGLIANALDFWATQSIRPCDGGGLSKHSGSYAGGEILDWENLTAGESECNGQHPERASTHFEVVENDYFSQMADNRAAIHHVTHESGWRGKTIETYE